MSRLTRSAGLGLAVALGLGFTACSNQGPGDDPASDPASGKVTITYSNFISNGGNESNLADIVAAFNKDNPDIVVELETLPYADYFTALQTDLAAGSAADVFDIEYANYATYQANGALAALEGVDRSVYQPSLADAYATGGVQYALPSSFSNVVLFYNKDLFDAAGVAYPTADWTWADEKAAAEKIADPAAGVWGDYQPISYNEFYKAVAQAGGQFLNADASSVAFDSPAGLAAAEWLTQKSGTVMPTVEQGAGTPDFDSNLFSQGKLGLWHTGIWMFGSLADATFQWDIAVEPGDSRPASAMFSNALAVSADSQHKAEAQKWAEFMSSSRAMVDVRLRAGWELPPIADQSQLDAYLDAGQPANRQAVFDSLDAVVLAPSIGQNQAQMQDIVTEELTEAAAGRKSAEEAVQSAAQRVEPLLQR
ncbi:MAG: sugar ABC transporter substrate-binding protein [Propionibacteriaceae bacterium]|jgi:multiple sugar transport system substrate-binding protein|nr:sugar ABC transporter substrate-binding protein [Propionibacteriaceae bacterium]